MSASKTLSAILLLVLAAPFAIGASVLVATPDYLLNGVQANVNLTITADSPFSGSVLLTYTSLAGNTLASFSSGEFTGNNYIYRWTISPTEAGSYSIAAAVKDSNNVIVATHNKTGTINSSGPRIMYTSPVGSISQSTVTIFVTTDQSALCKFDTDDKSYDGLTNTFANTNAVNHSQTLGDLSTGVYRYYVKCKNSQNLITANSALIEFTIDNLPSAQIKLKDPSPVKEGIIEVEVVTSKSLPNAPILEYTFNDEPAARIQVSLTGSETHWRGYLVITPNDDNKVGTFYFRGVDSSGNLGTRITNNNLFIVDTTKPPAPVSMKAVALVDGAVRLNWYYDGEEEDHFNIYRAAISGVKYVDYYATSNGTAIFTDRATVDKVTYYYRVSVVDNAGNEGPLSEEVFATVTNRFKKEEIVETEQVPEAPKVLPPTLVPKVDTALKGIEKIIIDVNDALEDYNLLESGAKELADQFKISQKLQEADLKLSNLKEQLLALKRVFATELELTESIKSIEQEAQKTIKITPQSASVLEENTFEQPITKEDVKIAAQEMVKNLGMSPEEIEEYTNQNTKTRDDFAIKGEIKIVSLEFLDGEKQEQSFITKRISYKNAEQLQDVVVVELIPKKIAANANLITFITQSYEILNQDPVVKFGFFEFNYQGEEIKYSVEKRIELEDAKNAKSIVLLNLNAPQEKKSLTGLAIAPLQSLGLSKMQVLYVWIGIFVIMGMLGYYMVFVRDSSMLLRKIKRADTLDRAGELFENQRDRNSRPTSIFDSERSSKVQDTLQNIYGHVHDAKKEFETKFHPALDELRHKFDHKLPLEVSLRAVQLQELLRQAQQYIADEQHHEAASLYIHISGLYNSLPKDLKSRFYAACADVHKSIRRW